VATFSTLKNRVQSTLSLKSTGNELTLLEGYLNEAYEDILTRTRCRVDCGDLSTTAGSWKYRMDTDALAVLELWAEDSSALTLPFERTSFAHILDLRRSASPSDADVRYFTVEGADLLCLWPTPSGAQALGFLYVPRPATLSAAGDIPSYIPAQWHRALEMYACWRMADYDDDGSSQVGELYRVHYEGVDGRGGILRDIRLQNRWQGGRRLAPARYGRRRAWQPPSRAYDS